MVAFLGLTDQVSYECPEDRGNVKDFIVTNMCVCWGGGSLERMLMEIRVHGALLSGILAAMAPTAPTPRRISTKEMTKIAGGQVLDTIKSFSGTDVLDGIENVTDLMRYKMKEVNLIFYTREKDVCIETTWKRCEKHWFFWRKWKKQEGTHVHRTGERYPKDSDIAEDWVRLKRICSNEIACACPCVSRNICIGFCDRLNKASPVN